MPNTSDSAVGRNKQGPLPSTEPLPQQAGRSHQQQRPYSVHATHGKPAGILAQLSEPMLPGAPRRHRYAASQACRSSLAMFDTIALMITIANNVTILVKSHRMLLYSQLLRLTPSVMLILATLLQRAWCTLSPDSYFSLRPRILLANRLMRFCFTLQVPYRTRLWFQDPAATAANIAAFIGAPPGARPTPTPASTFVNTLILSGALHAFVSSINLPLPLLPQIASQAAFFTLLAVTNALPAAACLASPLLALPTHRLCTTMSDLFALLVAGFSETRIDADALADVCTDDGPLVVVMFCLVYFALMLPIYVGYRFEQHMQRGTRAAGAFEIRGEQQRQAPERWWAAAAQQDVPHSVPGMVVCDVILLVLLGGVAWALTVMLLPLLKRVMLPV